MSSSENPKQTLSAKVWFYGFIVVMVLGGALLFLQADPDQTTTAHLEVYVPKLEGEELRGSELYHEHCASCHGENAAGSEKGPPFVHKIYEEKQHVDAAFFDAVKRGVQAHHWPYGNMPAIKGVTDDQVGAIVLFVRKMQRVNGMK